MADTMPEICPLEQAKKHEVVDTKLLDVLRVPEWEAELERTDVPTPVGFSGVGKNGTSLGVIWRKRD